MKEVITFEDYWKNNYEVYNIILDNEGNFKYGEGIIPYKVAKQTEMIMRKHIRKRKNDVKLDVIWDKKAKEVTTIYRKN